MQEGREHVEAAWGYEWGLRPKNTKLVSKDVVVIDDDESFCLAMVQALKKVGVSADYYTSLLDMGTIGRFESYKAAILDFYLEQMNGLEIAAYFPVFFNGMPILLVSAEDMRAQGRSLWPSAIQAFRPKSVGIHGLVAATRQLLEVA